MNGLQNGHSCRAAFDIFSIYKPESIGLRDENDLLELKVQSASTRHMSICRDHINSELAMKDSANPSPEVNPCIIANSARKTIFREFCFAPTWEDFIDDLDRANRFWWWKHVANDSESGE